MRRILLTCAAFFAALGPLTTAVARPPPWAHEGGRHGPERGPQRGPERGPPPWARSEGRFEPGGRFEPVPPPGAFGPPPGAFRRPFGMRRGGYLPPDLRGGVIENPGRFRLRPPPRGYSWVRVGNAFVLMDLSTGQIFDMIAD